MRGNLLSALLVQNYVTKCSVAYWSLDLLQVRSNASCNKKPIFFFFLIFCRVDQIPVTVGVTSYEVIKLYKGKRVITSKGSEAAANWKVYKLVYFCAFGIAAGLIGGLLGLGGGFIMGPLFLEMGIPPQVPLLVS